MDKRSLVVGDIHGGYRALTQVLDRAGTGSNDHLIFIGDYVDGWSESALTIEFLLQFSRKTDCTFIIGNHDIWLRQWLKTGKPDPEWQKSGGAQTMQEYQLLSDHQKQEHLHFLERMHDYVIDKENRLYIHAGFTSMHGPQREKDAYNYSNDRTLWETALAAIKITDARSVFYPRRLRHFSEIFIGHTPTTKYYGVGIPMNGANVWNIDTGAAFTGKLTVMDINSKQFWQSDKLPDLYPGEKGRN